MGVCASNPGDKRSKESELIDQQLREDARRDSHIIRLLLLGTGESGKSTLAKQLRILGRVPFTEDERELYRSAIQENVKICGLRLAHAWKHAAENGAAVKLGKSAKKVLSELDEETLEEKDFKDIYDSFAQVWEDKSLRNAIATNPAFSTLPDSLPYFFNNLSRFADLEYMPTDEDIIRVRVKTTGVSETRFQYEGHGFVLVDVGGQRSERRKWLQCFQDVTAIIYTVNLAEYDMVLEEDETQSRTAETISVFDTTLNSRFLRGIPVMLFLNKRDLFEEKLKVKPLNTVFPDYKGKSDWQAGADYIKQKLIDVAPDDTKNRIYTHVTCAVDAANIKFVFMAVRDIIIHDALNSIEF